MDFRCYRCMTKAAFLCSTHPTQSRNDWASLDFSTRNHISSSHCLREECVNSLRLSFKELSATSTIRSGVLLVGCIESTMNLLSRQRQRWKSYLNKYFFSFFLKYFLFYFYIFKIFPYNITKKQIWYYVCYLYKKEEIIIIECDTRGWEWKGSSEWKLKWINADSPTFTGSVGEYFL